MNIGKSLPSDWDHFSGSIEFHGAGAKRNHRVSQTNIFVSQTLNVPHHLSLTSNVFKQFLLHEFTRSFEFLVVLTILAVLEDCFGDVGRVKVQLLSAVLPELSKDLYQIVKVDQSGCFIERH